MKWTGNLRDDCTAVDGEYMLRAEMMRDGFWWWCVYRADERVYDSEIHAYTGKQARQLAELYYELDRLKIEVAKNQILKELK